MEVMREDLFKSPFPHILLVIDPSRENVIASSESESSKQMLGGNMQGSGACPGQM